MVHRNTLFTIAFMVGIHGTKAQMSGHWNKFSIHTRSIQHLRAGVNKEAAELGLVEENIN